MLHEVISSLAPNVPDQHDLIQVFAKAFCFREGEAYPIFGWSADGSDYLKDSDLDYLMSKRISRTRAEWDSTPALSANP